MKKKLLSTIIVLLLTFSLGACHSKEKTSNNEDDYLNEPHKQEQAEDYSRDQIEESKARREADAIQCGMAQDFVGEKATIKGSVESINQSKDSKGKPTFIDLDYAYPNKDRVTIIVWEENLNKLRETIDGLVYGDIVYVTGTIEMYDGVAQIEVSDSSQIEIE